MEHTVMPAHAVCITFLHQAFAGKLRLAALLLMLLFPASLPATDTVAPPPTTQTPPAPSSSAAHSTAERAEALYQRKLLTGLILFLLLVGVVYRWKFRRQSR
jgi:hypothetical protein